MYGLGGSNRPFAEHVVPIFIQFVRRWNVRMPAAEVSKDHTHIVFKRTRGLQLPFFGNQHCGTNLDLDLYLIMHANIIISECM